MQLLMSHVKGVYKPDHIQKIYWLGDCHVGNAACHDKLLERMVRHIKDEPESKVILMGDIIDAIAVKDKRYRANALPGWLRDKGRDDEINLQCEAASDYLLPIKDQVISVLRGNHEESVLDAASVDPMRMVCQGLFGERTKLIYNGSYCAFIRMSWTQGNSKHWSCNIAVSHGHGGGVLIGAKANRLERTAGFFPTADLVAQGHVHSRLHDPNHVTLDVELLHHGTGIGLQEHVAHCFLTGSTLRGYFSETSGSLYTERAGLPPCALGGMFATVELKRDRHTEYIKLNGGCYP